jgi:hypothetical protein
MIAISITSGNFADSILLIKGEIKLTRSACSEQVEINVDADSGESGMQNSVGIVAHAMTRSFVVSDIFIGQVLGTTKAYFVFLQCTGIGAVTTRCHRGGHYAHLEFMLDAGRQNPQ